MVIYNTKICTHCEIEKDISKFYKKKTSSDGFDYICKDCYKEWNIKWYSINHKHAILQRSKYRRENTDKCHTLTKRWMKKNPEKVKDIRLRQKAKRRNMKCIKLFENPFPNEVEIDYHHINSMLTIPMPKKIHNMCSHRNREVHMYKCKVWLYQLYGLDISKFVN